ncbi:RHS repeat-associated core domain-containing protein [Kitasatospora sp. SolWspMP-SS2h]|uniref:RHS repeat-associated core domain-containing protein n=1 Tax=Kitasatospora sp. SolWspMP-SS2h TaxID=1305729 RepID=UPI000DB93749
MDVDSIRPASALYRRFRAAVEFAMVPPCQAGIPLDPTVIYKLGARSYDPALGRFTQPDPSGRETNTYAYTAGDPVNHTDPNGLFAWKDVVVGVAGVLAVAGAAAIIAPACAGTAGIGCALAGSVTAGLWGGAAAGGTAAMLGLDPEGYLEAGVGAGLLAPFVPGF